METIYLTRSTHNGKYLLLGLDHLVQVLLFWAIVGCAITVYGLVISAFLMIPWGVVQLLSALYNTYDKWGHPTYYSHYRLYWILVSVAALVFGLMGFLPRSMTQYCFVAGMLLSAGIGCYHTYIIHNIYKKMY